MDVSLGVIDGGVAAEMGVAFENDEAFEMGGSF